MLYHWIGDASFRKGMHNYLTKFSYNNALTEDLWEALGAASGLPVADVMSGWTGQMVRCIPLYIMKEKHFFIEIVYALDQYFFVRWRGVNLQGGPLIRYRMRSSLTIRLQGTDRIYL